MQLVQCQTIIQSPDDDNVFLAARDPAADGALLSEANGLMVRLRPHQP